MTNNKASAVINYMKLDVANSAHLIHLEIIMYAIVKP